MQHCVEAHSVLDAHVLGCEQHVLPIEQVPVEICCDPAGQLAPTTQEPSHDRPLGHEGPEEPAATIGSQVHVSWLHNAQTPLVDEPLYVANMQLAVIEQGVPALGRLVGHGSVAGARQCHQGFVPLQPPKGEMHDEHAQRVPSS